MYKRGALALHALRARLGDERFFALLHEWSARYRHATVTTEQFVALAEQTAGASLIEFFAAWLDETGLPEPPG